MLISASFISSNAPDGVRCDGPVLGDLPQGTIEVLELDANHVRLDINVTGTLMSFKGQVSAPLCNGPESCGCAP